MLNIKDDSRRSVWHCYIEREEECGTTLKDRIYGTHELSLVTLIYIYIYIYIYKGTVSVQWIFSLDTARFGHVSKSRHVSKIQRVQWKNSLDTSLALHIKPKRLKLPQFSKSTLFIKIKLLKINKTLNTVIMSNPISISPPKQTR